MSYSSCFCLLDRTIQICVSCIRAVTIWFFEYNSYWPLDEKTDTWVLPALLYRLQKWKVSLSVLRPYATHCNKSVCMAVVPEGSLFWSWLTKKPANSFLKTTWPRAWITGTMSCGLMSLMPSSHCTIFKLVGSPLFSHCMTIWGRIQSLLFSHCTMDPWQGVSHCTISQ